MPFIEVLIVLLLIVVNGVLAMSELAIVSSRKVRLEALADAGSSGAKVALGLIGDPGRFLSTVQIGITLVGIFAGAFGGATLAAPLAHLLDQFAWIAPNGAAVAFVIVVVVITYLSLVIGELVPKRIALASPERMAALVAKPMRTLSWVAAPAVWLLKHSSDAVLGLLGLGRTEPSSITEEEVKALIAEGTRTGVFAPQEREMIDGVLRIADRTVRAVMTQRLDIVWIERTATRDELVHLFEAERHRRILVCDGGIDHAVGYIDMADVLATLLRGDAIDIPALIKRPLVISEWLGVLRLIDLFRREGIHFAVVVDEYGVTQGLVTALDILEGIAGALPERGEEDEPGIVHRPDGSMLVDGLMPIHAFAAGLDARGLETSRDYDTVAGLVLHALGRIPAVGDAVEVAGLRIEVVDMDGRRIDKVIVTQLPAPSAA
ncbi:MAG: HlyC/CorC family transporter [Bauldia sp.]|nr:HlyC/CorC family transporter [Bauldia sp.]